MKIYTFMLLACLLAFSTQNIYSLSDEAVVDSIKAYSDLTQSDVNRWKLLWLGGLAEPTASAAGLYGVYKAYKASGSITPSKQALQNVFKNEMYQMIARGYQPSETIQNLVANNWTWAGASVIGSGVLAYKFLRPRVQAGLLEKIRNYVTLCERLAVTQQSYYSEQAFKNGLNQLGNTVWTVSNAFAQKEGFENLIEQANVALLLIDQLEPSIPEETRAELITLRQKVISFRNNAQYNVQFIQNDLLKEQQLRAQQRSEYGKILDLQKQELGVAGQRVKNVASQWKLLKDVAETAHKYGPSVLGVVGVATGIKWLQEWARPSSKNKKEELNPFSQTRQFSS